jgi:recombination protein RecR
MADSIKKLQDLFSKFPTVGRRTAGRFVYYLIHQPTQTTDELIAAIHELKKGVKLCAWCFNPHETSEKLCLICADPSRNKQQLCIVEKEADLLTIEASKRYKGLYFILGATLPESPRLLDLKKRVSAGNLEEVIIAINSTPDGKATTTLIERTLKELPQKLKITRLAQGLPVGGELEYADEETLEGAFEGRK